MNDKAIEYESTLYKVNRGIASLKKIGINTSKFEKNLSLISKNCEEEISKLTIDSTGVMTSGYLDAEYNKAIKHLNSLFIELNSYEVYLRIASFANVLREFIIKEEKTENDFLETRTSLINILRSLKQSGTLKFDEESSIVNDIYRLTYDFIKEEIKELGSSPTLLLLKDDDIHKYNLDKLITRELENINLKDSKYKNVVKRKNELEQDGLSAHYVDEDLIKAILNTTLPDEYYKKKLEELSLIINKYYESAKEYLKNLDEEDKNYTYYEEEYKAERRSLLKSLALFGVSLSVSISLLIGGFFIGRRLGTTKKFKTIKTTTSELSSDEVKEELYLDTDSKRLLIKVNPYQEKTSGYERNIITYNVSELGDLSLEEYKNIDLDSYKIKGQDSKEKKKTLEENDDYTEIYYILENYLIDESDFEIEHNNLFVLTYLLWAGILIYWLNCLYQKISHEAGFFVFNTFENTIMDLIDSREASDNIAKTYFKIHSIKHDLNEIFLENEDKIKFVINMLPLLKDKPEFKEDIKKIEKTLKKIKSVEDEYKKNYDTR